MNPHLQCVSLTGADDNTCLEDLHTLGDRYPFVEWALLHVPGKEGQPRNPTSTWLDAFLAHPPAGTLAIHLCGKMAFDQLLSDTIPKSLLLADRLQLNVNARRMDFDENQVVALYQHALGLGVDLILQRHEFTAKAIDRFLMGLTEEHHVAAKVFGDRPMVGVLIDDSRGKGISPEHFRVPFETYGATVGFAGGLGPHNVADVLPKVESLGIPYWIDMESGLRTHNAFDLEKARAVLAACEPYAC